MLCISVTKLVPMQPRMGPPESGAGDNLFPYQAHLPRARPLYVQPATISVAATGTIAQPC